MIIRQALEQAYNILIPQQTEPMLDAEVLLSFVLGKDKAWLWAHPLEELAPSAWEKFQTLVHRRAQHEPLAYILGHKEFYGHKFLVNPAVLIPRPASEAILDALKQDFPDFTLPLKIIDVGTGSGCLAISAALQYPVAQVLGLDLSPEALSVAQSNAVNLQAKNVSFKQSNLLSGAPQEFKADIIIANLPYLREQDVKNSPTSAELCFEPPLALIAPEQGLLLIKGLVKQAAAYLSNQGVIYLEMQAWQKDALRKWVQEFTPQYQVIDCGPLTLKLALVKTN